MSKTAHLTTTGRKTGLPRRVEVWFVRRGDSCCLLAHPWSMWWRNLESTPSGVLEVGGDRFKVEKTGLSGDEGCIAEVMDMFREKYGSVQVRAWYEGSHRRAVQLHIRGDAAEDPSNA